MKKTLLIFLNLYLAVCLTACMNAYITPDQQLSSEGRAVAAKLGVLLQSEELKNVFTTEKENLLVQSSGVLFSNIILLPPESRFTVTQDLRDEYGIDLLLTLKVSDFKMYGGVNTNMFLALPSTWLAPIFPVATLGCQVTLEGNLRDTNSGKIVSTNKEVVDVQDTESPLRMAKVLDSIKQRAVRNATVMALKNLNKEMASYAPGRVAERPKQSNKTQKNALVDSNKRYALIFGIEKYRERIPNAEFAVNDANAVADFLVKKAGYKEENVIVRANEQATKSDMDKYVNAWLKNNMDSSSSLLVYFSGHGTPKTSNGEGYIVPYDGDPTFIEQTGLSLKSLYTSLESLPAKEVIVMMDVGFTGTGNRSVMPAGAKPLVLNAQQQINPHGKKTVVLTASSGSTISLAYKGRKHGLFTYFVLQGLNGDAVTNDDGSVDIQELFAYLKPQVQRVARKEFNAEQVPQLLVPNQLMTKAPLKIVIGN